MLRDDELAKVSIVRVGPRSNLSSVARTFIIKHRSPVVVMLDTDTLEPIAIWNLVQLYESLVGAVAAGSVPYKIIHSIPELEAIFFDDTDGKFDAHEMFPRVPPSFMKMVAQKRPREALDYLFAEGGGPPNFTEFLAKLGGEDKANLRKVYPIHQLTTFIEECMAVAR